MDKDKKKFSIGVDFDGTLAHYDEWKGAEHLGKPVKKMVEEVKKVLAAGGDVFIFTARVNPGGHTFDEGLEATESYVLIAEWCKKHIGKLLPITHEKNKLWDEVWDDRGRQVIQNTGVFVSELMDKPGADHAK